MRSGWKGVGALLQAVPWRPVLFSPGDRTERPPDRIGSFFVDAPNFVELVSVLQRVPIVSMAMFPNRTHRTVPLLLGTPRQHGGMG